MADVSFRDKSRRMALCGVLAALAVVLLSAGAIIPFATFCCPILAMLCMLPAVEEYGGKCVLILYAAVALLALLMAPDKEVALLFTFLGWYPALRAPLEQRIPGRLLPLLVKLALFAAAISAMYALAIFVLDMGYLVQEYTAGGQLMLWVMVVLGGVLWLLCDKVLGRFSLLYRRQWRGKIFRG